MPIPKSKNYGIALFYPKRRQWLLIYLGNKREALVEYRKFKSRLGLVGKPLKTIMSKISLCYTMQKKIGQAVNLPIPPRN